MSLLTAKICQDPVGPSFGTAKPWVGRWMDQFCVCVCVELWRPPKIHFFGYFLVFKTFQDRQCYSGSTFQLFSMFEFKPNLAYPKMIPLTRRCFSRVTQPPNSIEKVAINPISSDPIRTWKVRQLSWTAQLWGNVPRQPVALELGLDMWSRSRCCCCCCCCCS